MDRVYMPYEGVNLANQKNRKLGVYGWELKEIHSLFYCCCIHNKNEVPSLLSITYNTIHPWPRKETELSAAVQATLITQHSGTSKILKGDRTVPTVQTQVCVVLHYTGVLLGPHSVLLCR